MISLLLSTAAAMGLLVGQSGSEPRYVGMRVFVADDGVQAVIGAQALIRGSGDLLWVLPVDSAPTDWHEPMTPLQVDRLLIAGAPRYDWGAVNQGGCMGGMTGGMIPGGDTGEESYLTTTEALPREGCGRQDMAPAGELAEGDVGIPLFRFWVEPEVKPENTVEQTVVPPEELDKWLSDVQALGYAPSEAQLTEIEARAAAGQTLLVVRIQASGVAEANGLMPTDLILWAAPSGEHDLPFSLAREQSDDELLVDLVTVGGGGLAPAAGYSLPPAREHLSFVDPEDAFAVADSVLRRGSQGSPSGLLLTHASTLTFARDEHLQLMEQLLSHGEAVAPEEGSLLDELAGGIFSEVSGWVEEVVDALSGSDEQSITDRQVDNLLQRLQDDGYLRSDFILSDGPVVQFAGIIPADQLQDLDLVESPALEPQAWTVGYRSAPAPNSWGLILPCLGLGLWMGRRRPDRAAPSGPQAP